MKDLIIKLFEKLACKHKWVLKRKTKNFVDGYELPSSFTFLYCCSECGKFEKVNI